MAVSEAPNKEIWFYHLERTSVEDTLPPLLEKCVERGWRAIIRSAIPANLDAIDTNLWTYRANSWLPHAKSTGDAAEDAHQSILLVHPPEPDSDLELEAPALFLLDGADWAGVTGISRIFVIFDGRDDDAVARARTDWRRAKEAGFVPAYWRQSEDGKWARN
jgi:DNA polymerase III subunit chi